MDSYALTLAPPLRPPRLKLAPWATILCLWFIITTTPLTFAALTPDEIWKKAGPTMVQIQCEYADGTKSNAVGFACYLGSKPYILSSYRAIGLPKTIRIGSDTNKMTALPVSSYRRNYQLDLALLAIPAKMELPPLHIHQQPVGKGEKAYILSPHSDNAGPSLMPVTLTAVDAQKLTLDPAAPVGTAGGPVLDQQGRVIGVISPAETGGQTMGQAISLAPMPPPLTFRNPNLTLMVALQEVIQLEKVLIDLTEAYKVNELHHYLMKYWWRALDTDPQPLSEFEAEQHPLLQSILSVHGDLTNAVETVDAVIALQRQLHGIIPELFKELPDDGQLTAYLAEFYKDIRRPSQLTTQEVTPLLAESVKFLDSRSDDKLNQIIFLFSVLPALKNDPAKMRRIGLALTEKEIKRRQKHIDYTQERSRAKTYGEITQLFLESLVKPYPLVGVEESRKMTIQQYNASHGGLELALSLYFAKTAQQHLRKGDTAKALSLLEIEATHKRNPDLHMHGFALICDGQYDRAYALLQKGAINARPELHSFLNNDFSAVRPREIALSTLLGHNFDPVPEKLAATVKKYPEYLSKKPWHKLAVSYDSPQAILSSPEYAALDKFGQLVVVFAIETRLGNGTKQEKETFIEAVKRNPAALAAYRDLYAD